MSAANGRTAGLYNGHLVGQKKGPAGQTGPFLRHHTERLTGSLGTDRLLPGAVPAVRADTGLDVLAGGHPLGDRTLARPGRSW